MQPSWVGKQHRNDMKNQSNMNMDANVFASAIINPIINQCSISNQFSIQWLEQFTT
jgi:hypothetical protein